MGGYARACRALRRCLRRYPPHRYLFTPIYGCFRRSWGLTPRNALLATALVSGVLHALLVSGALPAAHTLLYGASFPLLTIILMARRRLAFVDTGVPCGGIAAIGPGRLPSAKDCP